MMPDPGPGFSLRAALCAGNKDRKRVQDGTCPADSLLADYISNAISERGEKEIIASHVAKCDKCFEKVASCVSALSVLDKAEQVSTGKRLLRRVLSMPKKYPRARFKDGYIKRNKYLYVAGLFFLLSFIFKPFFLQFLTAALIFGVKWIMDTGSTKALIMIYKTWKQSKTPDSDPDSKDRINRRRI
jgi:hypothetical protein